MGWWVLLLGVLGVEEVGGGGGKKAGGGGMGGEVRVKEPGRPCLGKAQAHSARPPFPRLRHKRQRASQETSEAWAVGLIDLFQGMMALLFFLFCSCLFFFSFFNSCICICALCRE